MLIEYLTYTKLGAIAMTTVIGIVYIAKATNDSAAHENLTNSFAGSSM